MLWDISPMSRLQELVSNRLQELGLGAVEAAVRGGLERTFIRDIVAGKKTSIRGASIGKLAAALEIPETALLQAISAPGSLAPTMKGEARLAPVTPPARVLPADVPILGTAAGSLAGAFRLGEEAIGWVQRPPGLAQARDIYAIYVQGSSMEPEHRPGDLRFVNPHRPPRVGDSVVVQTRWHENRDVESYLGHLKRRTEEKTAIGKLNPVAEVDFENRFVVAVHKVLDMNELFGV